MAARKPVAFDPIAAEIAAMAAKQALAAKKEVGTGGRKPKEESATTKPKAVIKLPKTPAAVADLLYTTQQERYALQGQAKKLEEVEAACREFLINTLPKAEASGVSGKVARVYVENKDIISVQDWPALYGYILKTAPVNPGIWGMLQKRISSEMAEELMSDKVERKKLAKALKKGQVPVVRINKL